MKEWEQEAFWQEGKGWGGGGGGEEGRRHLGGQIDCYIFFFVYGCQGLCQFRREKEEGRGGRNGQPKIGLDGLC